MTETNARVLLFEDDQDLADLILSRLQGEVGSVFHARTKPVALELIDRHTPTLLILDYSLPDTDALEFVRELRQQGLGIPFIVSTGFGDEALAVEIMKAGAEDYLVKDATFLNRLVMTVKRVLVQSRMEERLLTAENALFESQERYRRIFNEAPEAIIIAEAKNGAITDVNKTACMMYGYDREKFLQLNLLALCPDVSIESLATLQQDNQHHVRRTHLRADGMSFPVELSRGGFRIRDREMLFLLIRDVTDQQYLQQRVDQKRKMEAIGQLAGGIAHDFNNQLAGIMGYVELLRQNLCEDEKLSTYVDMIQSAAQNAANLTSQLLNFSRKSKIRREMVDLHSLIRCVADILEHSLGKTITIYQHLAEQTLYTHGDANQLQNALLNLAINARDAMPQGGELHFTTTVRTLEEADCRQRLCETQPGDYVQIGVRDTGYGMNAETQRRMFEPFFTTKEVGKGTGMGLASVYGTAKNHGGSLDVESEPGHGTTINLFLPCRRPEKPEHEPERPPPGVIEPLDKLHGDARILLVDDEKAIRDLSSEMLENLGYQVTVCGNGREALDIYAPDKFDLIILDIMMPRRNGQQTLTDLLGVDPQARIILMSGYATEAEAGWANAGASAFLQKPFTLVQIARSIQKVLEA